MRMELSCRMIMGCKLIPGLFVTCKKCGALNDFKEANDDATLTGLAFNENVKVELVCYNCTNKIHPVEPEEVDIEMIPYGVPIDYIPELI